MRRFAGFPAGKSGAVYVPARFFSDLLPLIDDLAELKLTVYCFWALQQREGKYRYVRLRDMLDDHTFMNGFDPDPEKAIQVLHHGIDLAIERGTLLHITVPGPAGDDELYFMNTAKGRGAIKALESGNWTPGAADQPVALIEERPNIFALYEQNIGPLTPLLSDILRDAENTYPALWIDEAMKIAVEKNVRNWRYVEAVLKRWTTFGKEDRPVAAANGKDQNPYLADEYFQRHDNDE